MARRQLPVAAAGVLAAALACNGDSTTPASPSAPLDPPSANRAPTISAALPDRTLTLNRDEQDTIDADSYFSDPDGDALTYEAASSNTHVATVRVSGGSVTLVARNLGRADVEVTASDPGGLNAMQRFSVTVERGEPAAELEITKCEADGTGLVDVSIEGTVHALTRLSSVSVIGYVDSHRVGEQTLGDIAAGETRQFAIRGSASVSPTSQCHVEFSASGNNARATEFIAFR